MKYQYHDLADFQFEDLVIEICYELFGIAVQGFAEGADGGRDARFEGLAQIFPSASLPWQGITIIQAKHTSGINRKFSESDFFGSDNAKINLEIPKVKKMFEEGKLNNYILFANRKLTANKNEEILDYISSKTGLNKGNIHLVGIEALERYLKKFSQAVANANLHAFDEPLKITPDDLAEVVEAFVNNDKVYEDVDKSLAKIKEIKRIKFQDKNEKNQLSEEYAKLIKTHMFKDGHFDEITNFLNHPDNARLKSLYEDSAEEFRSKLITYKRDFDKFDLILDYMRDKLVERDPDLSKNKRLTRVFLHYMYFYCDIG